MENQVILALKNNKLLKNILFDELKLENIKGQLITKSEGEILFRDSDDALFLYLVVSGEINLLKKRENQKTESLVVGENDFFGADEFLQQGKRHSTAVALRDSYIIALSKAEVDYLVEQNDNVLANLYGSVDQGEQNTGNTQPVSDEVGNIGFDVPEQDLPQEPEVQPNLETSDSISLDGLEDINITEGDVPDLEETPAPEPTPVELPEEEKPAETSLEDINLDDIAIPDDNLDLSGDANLSADSFKKPDEEINLDQSPVIENTPDLSIDKSLTDDPLKFDDDIKLDDVSAPDADLDQTVDKSLIDDSIQIENAETKLDESPAADQNLDIPDDINLSDDTLKLDDDIKLEDNLTPNVDPPVQPADDISFNEEIKIDDLETNISDVKSVDNILADSAPDREADVEINFDDLNKAELGTPPAAEAPPVPEKEVPPVEKPFQAADTPPPVAQPPAENEPAAPEAAPAQAPEPVIRKTTFSGSNSFELLEKINDAAQLVNSNIKIDEVLQNIVKVASDLTGADRGTLYLVEKGKDELWSKIAMGNEFKEIKLKVGEGIAGWVAKNGELVNLEDAKQDPRFNETYDKTSGYSTKSMLCFPIKNRGGNITGVLQLLNSKNGKFSNVDEELLEALSIHAAMALQNAELVEQLLKGERIASLGKMANFLIQDIKKPVMVSKRYTEHLKTKELPEESAKVVDMLLEQLDHIAELVNSTSNYAEGQIVSRSELRKLNEVLEDFVQRMDSYVRSRNCKLETDFEDDVDVQVSEKQLFQAVQHIIKNACDAMPDGGDIVLFTEIEGQVANITIKDNGLGIPETLHEKIFEPFMSHGKKEGTGLGLSITRKIIQEHGGKIKVESAMGEGAKFVISLPVSSA